MNEFEEFSKNVEKMEMSHTILRESIKDLTSAADALKEYIDFMKDPFRIALSHDIKADLGSRHSKFALHIAMATNKLAALDGYMNEKGE